MSLLFAITGFIVLQESGGEPGDAQTRQAGDYHWLISIQPLLETDGKMCNWAPASGGSSLIRGLQKGASRPETAPTEAARNRAARRQPVRVIRDTYSTYSAVAFDPTHDEVVMADENNFSILVYDRLENTPRTAAMSEPKRMIRGEATHIEFPCGVYVDPASGDIYGVNNDTANWMFVFDRNAKGNAPPTRKLAAPHTTFGIVADAQEVFMTVQDDHAVVVFNKTAKDEDAAVRVLQGPRTLMADPHGIALDPKTNLMYVTNWGSNNERITPSRANGKRNFPIRRENITPSSGKFQPPSITVYPKTAKADTPPLRVIQGPKTLMNWPTSIAVHPDRAELFVANDTGDSVTVFRTDTSGDVAPIRVLKGSRTLIKNPTGVAVDAQNNELWVANFGNHSATVFKVDADGNIPPLRVIRSAPADSPSPMLSNPHTVAYDSKREEILVAS